MTPPRRDNGSTDLGPERTAELLDKLASAVRESKMLKAKVVKAQTEETAPALRKPKRKVRST